VNFKVSESARKLSGSYYTPPEIAAFLARWVSLEKPSSILEPSCGDGAFFTALARLNSKRHDVSVVGVEIDPKGCASLDLRIKAGEFSPLTTELICEDFLFYSMRAENAGDTFDAVVGNPPFIRYQYLDPAHQELTEKIFRRANLPFTKHTNAWVPFVIQSMRLLRPGGRLAMVIPAELVHILHAKPLRDFLTRHCTKIAVVDLEELFSSEVLQGVVLLLCTKADPAVRSIATLSFERVTGSDVLNGHAARFFDSLEFRSAALFDHKWMGALLTDEELAVYHKATLLPKVFRFRDVASPDVGIVTGANNFFLVTASVVEQFKLHPFAVPMFGRSSHARGVIFTSREHKENVEAGLPAFFINLPNTPVSRLPSSVQRYIKTGEEAGLPSRYKCRIRTPWYCVPSVWSTEIAMLKRAHTVPRLIFNKAGALTTDTAYRIALHSDFRHKGKAFVAGFVNSLTALCAELEGRHYGGGVLELVPSEIERLSVPIIDGAEDLLEGLDNAFRGDRLITDIVAEQDRVLLVKVGLSLKEIAVLNRAWQRLVSRRHRTTSIEDTVD
jgi:adenine-specific DNA-methyltransferase